jgi:hypothetical protein
MSQRERRICPSQQTTAMIMLLSQKGSIYVSVVAVVVVVLAFPTSQLIFCIIY